MVWILLYLAVGFTAWCIDYYRSRNKYDAKDIALLLPILTLIGAPVLAAGFVVTLTPMAVGFLTGCVVAAFRRGYREGNAFNS